LMLRAVVVTRQLVSEPFLSLLHAPPWK
jgi:hypothetical protein